MIPKRQLLLLFKKAGLNDLSKCNRFKVVFVSSSKWLSTCPVVCTRATPQDEKFMSSPKSHEDDFNSVSDDERFAYHPHSNGSHKSESYTQKPKRFYTVERSDLKPFFNRKHFTQHGFKHRDKQTEDFRSFKGRKETFNQISSGYSSRVDSEFSDLVYKVGRKAKTFQESSPIVKDFYSEHPNVTSRSTEEIQNFLDKFEITIRGLRKQRPIFNFEEAGFPDNIMSALESMKFDEPSPIQCIAWPHALSGSDIVGIAQTGSGKTLSFILPAIVHSTKRKQSSTKFNGPITLVICPTRELALQVCRVAEGLRRHTRISSIPIYGGQSKIVQMQRLRQINPKIVVATPGRLIDLLSCDAITLDDVSYVVLDEADRMLDMGFEPQIRAIMDHIQSQRQVLMFSATWPYEIHEMANDYLKDYVHLKIGAMHLTINPDVQQEFIECEFHQKEPELLAQLQSTSLSGTSIKTLIFCERKYTCEEIHRMLRRSGISCLFIHGDCTQARRDQVMKDFRDGNSTVLIATDIAARGIDVSDIGLVINYDMPQNIDSYVHRVGRTARAGRKGTSISFITEGDFGIIPSLTTLLEDTKQDVPKFFYALDRQGRRLKSAKKRLKSMHAMRIPNSRKFRY